MSNCYIFLIKLKALLGPISSEETYTSLSAQLKDKTLDFYLFEGLSKCSKGDSKELLSNAINYAISKFNSDSTQYKQLALMQKYNSLNDGTYASANLIINSINAESGDIDPNYEFAYYSDNDAVDEGADYVSQLINFRLYNKKVPSKELLENYVYGDYSGEWRDYLDFVDGKITALFSSFSLNPYVFKPLVYQILFCLYDRRLEFAKKLCRSISHMMMISEVNYSNADNTAKRLGARGGRRVHPRKSIALDFAKDIWSKNPTLSLENVSYETFQYVASKFNDAPSRKTIQDWLRKADFRPR